MLKKTGKIIFILFAAAALVALGYLLSRLFSSGSGAKETAAAISNEQGGGKVLAEESSVPVATQFYASQNYRVPQISFGGDAIVVPSGERAAAPEISELRSELLMTKTDEKVKFLLSWKTNKPCASSVEYGRDGQAEPKTVSEDGYGFIHSVEVAPLAYSTSYSYTIAARDKWGNEVRSEKLSFYTGAPRVSILDLLGGAFKDMFGWARR